jgi:hypothetical protein
MTTVKEAADEAWTYLPVLHAAAEATEPDLHRDMLLMDVVGDLLNALTDDLEGAVADPDTYAFVKSFIDLSHACLGGSRA